MLHLCSPDYSTAHFKAGPLQVNAALCFVVMNSDLLIEVPVLSEVLSQLAEGRIQYIKWF